MVWGKAFRTERTRSGGTWLLEEDETAGVVDLGWADDGAETGYVGTFLGRATAVAAIDAMEGCRASWRLDDPLGSAGFSRVPPSGLVAGSLPYVKEIAPGTSAYVTVGSDISAVVVSGTERTSVATILASAGLRDAFPDVTARTAALAGVLGALGAWKPDQS